MLEDTWPKIESWENNVKFFNLTNKNVIEKDILCFQNLPKQHNLDSMARANLKKSKYFSTSTTTASKYPRGPKPASIEIPLSVSSEEGIDADSGPLLYVL